MVLCVIIRRWGLSVLQHYYRVVGVAAQVSYARLKERVARQAYRSSQMAAQMSKNRRDFHERHAAQADEYAAGATALPNLTAASRITAPRWGVYDLGVRS